MTHSLWRLCPGQSPPHSPLMTFESEEVWSSVLFKLPAKVPSSRLLVALVGLEWGLTSSCPCCSKMVLVPSINSSVPSLPSGRAVFTPSLDFLGVNTGHLVAIIVKWTAARVSPLFLSRDGKELSKSVPHRGVPTKGWSCRKGVREEECQLDGLDCSRSLELVIPLARVQLQ